MSLFRNVTRDELWSRGRLLEQRLSHGEAVQRGDEIDARDSCDHALLALCDREMSRLRSFSSFDARVRLVADARSEDGAIETSATIVIDSAIVTTPEHAHTDLALLQSGGQALLPVLSVRTGRSACPPLLWLNGSASVLLHEAIGHAAEHHHAAIAWPSWLEVDAPLKPRRESFRDVPLMRMVRLIARQYDAPFELPEKRIEVHLVAGGNYEPLTETVTLRIARAAFIDADRSEALAPFELVQTRESIARALAGATGEPLRYPGVICSREGQELVVPSAAPIMVTSFR